MLQAIISSPKIIELKQVEVPRPKDGEVLIKMKCNAVCGSEFSAFLGHATANPYYLGIAKYPYGPFGHEGTGEIVELGQGVNGFHIGDRIAGMDIGSYAGYCIVPVESMIKIPDGITYQEASLVTTVGETYWVINELLKINSEDTVFISGMGSTGLLLLEQARNAGVKKIICADLNEYRIKLAKELGSTLSVNPAGEDVQAVVKSLADNGVSVSIDTTGVEQSIVNAVKAAAKFAKVGLFGRPIKPIKDFMIEDLFHNMLTVYGAKCRPEVYDVKYAKKAIELIGKKKIHSDKIISHEFTLEKIQEAFESAAIKKEGIKVLVKCSD